jgi:hypothetical protein
MTVRALAADAVAATAPNGMASVAKQSKREEKRGLGKPLERLKKIGFVWPSIIPQEMNRSRPIRSNRSSATGGALCDDPPLPVGVSGSMIGCPRLGKGRTSDEECCGRA